MTNSMSQVIQQLRRATLRRDGAGLTDGQLLERYISRREEAAFAALVRRHGPMVWGVCRRVLGNHHDAEDAFQATFLVLVRKAASVVPREMVANFLHGVAHQTALKARATSTKRRVRERQVMEMPEPKGMEQDCCRDLQSLLDQELSHLPDKYRIPIVLCDLEGKTRAEAARQLGWPEGTVAGRLARARTMLAKRLARHGLMLSAGSLAAVLGHHAASACVPPSVVSSTIQAANLFAMGPMAASAVISAKAVSLTEGVLKSMLLTKLKIGMVVLFVTGVLAVGGGGIAYRAQAAEGAGTERDKVSAGQTPLVRQAEKASGEEEANPPLAEEDAKKRYEELLKHYLNDIQALKDVHELHRLMEKEEIRRLTEEIRRLRAENQRLKGEDAYAKAVRVIERVMFKLEATDTSVRAIEKAMKKLREQAKNKETELEALDEIEKAVKEMKEKAKKRKD